MKLTETQIRALKPREKLYRVADGHGLTLEVTPNGSKLWRYKYRYMGKQKRLALGRYPDVGLAEARKRRDDARRRHPAPCRAELQHSLCVLPGVVGMPGRARHDPADAAHPARQGGDAVTKK